MNFVLFPETTERRDSDCNTFLFEFGENLREMEEVCSNPLSCRKTLTSENSSSGQTFDSSYLSHMSGASTSSSPVDQKTDAVFLSPMEVRPPSIGSHSGQKFDNSFLSPIGGPSSSFGGSFSNSGEAQMTSYGSSPRENITNCGSSAGKQCAIHSNMPPVHESWFEDSNPGNSQQSIASSSSSSFSYNSSQLGTSSSISSLENFGGYSYSFSGQSSCSSSGSNQSGSQKRQSIAQMEQQLSKMEFLVKNNPKLNDDFNFRRDMQNLKNRLSCKKWRCRKRKLDKANTEKIASLEQELKKAKAENENKNKQVYGVFKTLMGLQENHVSNEAKQFIKQNILQINGD